MGWRLQNLFVCLWIIDLPPKTWSSFSVSVE
jgi:hypothetical protein